MRKKTKAAKAPVFNSTGHYGEHWVALKLKEFLAGLDEEGKPIHTTEEKDALKFDSFSDAMLYLSLGYSILKRY